MLARLSVVWGAELVASPAVWGLARAAPPAWRERLVSAQNEVRARALRWACPEFRGP